MNNLFKALNDPTRRKILHMLREHEMSAGEIANAFSISKPSISHHLYVLNTAGLVSKSRDGQFIRYSLNATVLEEAANWIFDLIEQDGEHHDEDV